MQPLLALPVGVISPPETPSLTVLAGSNSHSSPFQREE